MRDSEFCLLFGFGYSVSTLYFQYWDDLDLMLPMTRQINGATLFMGCPKRKKKHKKTTTKNPKTFMSNKLPH